MAIGGGWEKYCKHDGALAVDHSKVAGSQAGQDEAAAPEYEPAKQTLHDVGEDVYDVEYEPAEQFTQLPPFAAITAPGMQYIVTAAAEGRLVKVPSPSWPSELRPQQRSSIPVVVFSAQV